MTTRYSKRVSIDFETYSEVDLLSCGAWAYSIHPSTEVICMAYAYDDKDPEIYTPLLDGPGIFYVGDDTEVCAWNSFFEWCIWHNTLKWPPLRIEQWTDTCAKALTLALPRSLGICAQAMGLDEQYLKDKRGNYLITRLCKPQKGGVRLRDEALENEMYGYCKQDVIVERKINSMLPELSESERKVWELDQKINIRGVTIDSPNVEHATKILDKEIVRLNKIIYHRSHRAVDKVSASSLKKHILPCFGIEVDSLDKEHLAELLEREDLPELARVFLQVYQLTGRTSTAKYSKLLETIDLKDNTIHGVLAYHVASTGRWSGQLFQPQNLPRPTFDDTHHCIEDLFKHEDPELIKLWYGEPVIALASCLRGMIVANPGAMLHVADYKSIESCALNWQANSEDSLNVLRTHMKIYEHTATQIYGGTIDTITSEQRFLGKVATLALGYQGGKGAFMTMAATYGVKDLDETLAEQIKYNWREANPEIVSYWYEIEDAAKKAIKNKGKTYTVKREYMKIQYFVKNNFLWCRLPSGRLLAYFQPRLKYDEHDRLQIVFSGTNTFTKRWDRHLNTYGGKLVENITQAIARDLLAYGMQCTERAGYRTVLTVHDEIIAEHEFGDQEEFEKLMCTLPRWAEGLPVAADGYTSHRYKKG